MKGVVCSATGSVLLARNERNEWELPGGWPTAADRTLTDTLVREIAEEAAITVSVGDLLDAELAVIGGHQVVVVAFHCSYGGEAAPRASDEHSELRWFSAEELIGLDLEGVYEKVILLARSLNQRSQTGGH